MLAGAAVLVNACSATYQAAPAVQERTWPAYLGSSRRAPAPSEAPTGNPQPVWRAQLARGINGSPALGEDVLAVSQTDRQVAVIARATGEVLWRQRFPNGLGAGPLLADDRVFVAEQANDARVYALRLSDGDELWAQSAGEVAAPLLLEGDGLYAASLGGTITRFRAEDGGRAWRVRLPGGVRAAPVAVSGGIVIATLSDSLFLLDRETGAIRARAATRGGVINAPAATPELIVAAGAAGWIEAFDTGTLERRWSYEAGEPVIGSVAAWRDVFYVVTQRGTLLRLPASGPGSVTRASLGLVCRAGPTPTDAGIYVAAVNGEVVLVDDGGTRRWHTRLDGRISEPPLVDNRTLIVTTRSGEVVVYR